MKSKFLKIAKVKDEASFYKKYPSEAAFFKAHPEAKKLIKKAQTGITSPFTGSGGNAFIPTGNFQSSWGSGQTQQPNVQLPQFPQQTAIDYNYQNQGTPEHNYNTVPVGGKGNNIMGALPGAISSIGTGIGKIKDAKKQLKSLDQQAQVTGVQAKAATSRDIDAPNVMARNMKKQRDAMFQPTDPNTLFPTYGVGTNVLAKNGTEIQNTFAPNTMYTDAAYEPLDDSNIKQYDFGGPIPIAQNGFSNFMTGGGGDAISGMLGDVTGNTGEGDIGSGIGSLAGTVLGGPLGGMVGGLAGKAIGSLFGQKRANQMKQFGNQIQTNQATMQGAALSNNLQSQYGGFMENGGNLTNPQLITKFGEYDVKDLFYPDPTMDTLRVGGHIRSFTPPSEHGLQEYAMGGDLQTHWGGHAETMSQNPYLPASGETVMFRGQSHDESDNNGRTGIGITYGESPVEVERGEPAVKLENGGEENLTVFGNLQIPKTHLDVIGDPNAKNKKFKTYVADLSNKEAKQNKIINKSSEAINMNKVFSPIDLLTFNSHSAMLKGADSKLKNYAEFKQNAAMLQNAINDTAEEHGILADDLAKGKYTIDKKAMKEQAKYGKELFKAVDGVPIGPAVLSNPTDNSQLVTPNYMENLNTTYLPSSSYKEDGIPGTASLDPDRYGINTWKGNVSKGDKYGKKTASSFSKEQWNSILDNLGYKGPKGNKAIQEFLMNDPRTKDIVKARHQSLYKKDPYIDPEHFGYGWAAPELANIKIPPAKQTTSIDKIEELPEVVVSTKKEKTPDVVPKKRNTFLDIASQIAPYLTPSFKNPLDANQLYGENYALGRNKVEPVQANLYNPLLETPYDISLQDQLNANQGDFNAIQRMTGNNPAALSALAGQKYGANSKVLADQFRMNQAEKAGVYGRNRQSLNDAQKTNLGIMDQQYVRQSQAKSNAEALTQSALNSMSDKIQKNKLETMGYNVYANKFPGYTFTSEGRLIKNPSFQQFEIPTVGSTASNSSKYNLPEGYDVWKNSEGKERVYKTNEKEARNGSLVKAFKNL